MTGAVPPDDDALRQAMRWCVRLAEVLDDVGRRVRQLDEQLTQDWPDRHGREWSERVAQLGSALGRDAADATELGEAYARQGNNAEGAGQAGPLGIPGGAAGPRAGMRLGATDATRVTDERGMRIAELPTDPPGPPG